jgi:hypothetical protein
VPNYWLLIESFITQKYRCKRAGWSNPAGVYVGGQKKHKILSNHKNIVDRQTNYFHSKQTIAQELLGTGLSSSVALECLRPILSFAPRGRVWPQGRSYPLRMKFSVRPSILLNGSECSPLGVNKGVNITPRGQLHPWGPGVKFSMALWTPNFVTIFSCALCRRFPVVMFMLPLSHRPCLKSFAAFLWPLCLVQTIEI